ncbi:uncharacterized protein LOC114737669 [Neltuma alba]|uniref:uncharacterized protein LOC114737669 n=1 Tax=Neltuma alba TaxID=207710 RepID=UPI0010A45055|nr:uncharacterized protein LOC114737669 [Prosopis alba]
MDCNREEAVRAKNVAEKKMENKDFTGARKIAIKAQQLFPDLENIAQMLIVCDVHCSAEKKFCNEKDWYGILQVEQTADEATIRKQYRKFALLLHPDKNKFAGAEAAFKLIGEAQAVLLDRQKRAAHDRSRTSYCAPRNIFVNVDTGVQTHNRANFTDLNPQQGFNNGSSTFWTVCPFCSIRFQYYLEVLNRSLRCQSCNRPFVAYDISMQGTVPPAHSSPHPFVQPQDGPNHHSVKVDVGSQGKSHGRNVNAKPFDKKFPTSRVSRKLNRKRQREQVVEISESSDSVHSSDSESGMASDDIISDEDGITNERNHATFREENPRRSSRKKQQVSYKENVSDGDDDGINVSKRVNGLADDLEYRKKGLKQKQKRKHGLYPEDILLNRKEETKEVLGKAVQGSKTAAEVNEHCVPNSACNITEQPNIIVCPDAEFNDFDKDKQKDCFAVGQVWAVYDTNDGMPRFYALIKKVFSSGFKLRITWFEPEPSNEDEINWVNKQLPVACGKYGLRHSETTEDHPMFSHRVLCEKIGSNAFEVYPRKGETWALYKNWDIKWYMDVESHPKYDFEFVEILTDYVEGEGVFIAYLAKLKGFVSLFSRIMKEGAYPIKIPSAELFRFSHRVPSFKMTGQERVGVPVGSWELDPASLPSPLNLEEVAVPIDLEVKDGHSPSSGVSRRSSERLKPMVAPDRNLHAFRDNFETSNLAKNNGSVNFVEDSSAPLSSTPEAMEIPDPQFYNFDDGKAPEKFHVGQIWAFYSDEDGLPRYYGEIVEIKRSPGFELHIMWLASCWLPDNTIRWEDKDMLISCGRFKSRNGNTNVYTNTLSLSHLVRVNFDRKDNEYSIFPRKGEVWALYRKWTPKIKCSDLVNWEYDIVEIIEENASWIEVLVMEIVSGYNSVFKPKTFEGSPITMRVPQAQLLRFSHQIPEFKLTEKHGSLKGFWELDPGAVPVHFWTSQ